MTRPDLWKAGRQEGEARRTARLWSIVLRWRLLVTAVPSPSISLLCDFFEHDLRQSGSRRDVEDSPQATIAEVDVQLSRESNRAAIGLRFGPLDDAVRVAPLDEVFGHARESRA